MMQKMLTDRMYRTIHMMNLTKIMVTTKDLGSGFCNMVTSPGYKHQASILGLTGGLWRIITDTIKNISMKIK